MRQPWVRHRDRAGYQDVLATIDHSLGIDPHALIRDEADRLVSILSPPPSPSASASVRVQLPDLSRVPLRWPDDLGIANLPADPDRAFGHLDPSIGPTEIDMQPAQIV